MILGPSDGIDDNQRWSFIGKATKLNKTVNVMQFRSISVWIESTVKYCKVLLSIITSTTTTTTIIITITVCLCCGTILSSVLSNEKVRRRVCNKGK